MKKSKMRLLAWVITLAIIIGMLPVTAFSVSAASGVWDGTVASGFARGTGTEAGPYIIETAEQLAYLASSVNSGITYSGKYIKLANDILLNDTTNWESWETNAPANSWTAIGNSSYRFAGTFDGNGHTVSGIYINTENDYQGLFGYIVRGTIKNLGVEKSYIKGNSDVGGVVGDNLDGTVTDCYNTGTVSGYLEIGGVVGVLGQCDNFDSFGFIDNCYNEGTVVGLGDEGHYVGGVVGFIWKGIAADCYNLGTVSGYENIGGVVGGNLGAVSGCYNEGTVSASCDGWSEGLSGVGGVVGYNNCGTVTDCYNTGIINGGDRVGGVIGYNRQYGGTVTGCYNTGTVTGSEDVGGVVGCNDSWEGSATVTDCYNTGTVSGDSGVGGVVGWNYYCTVTDCYNTGTVNGNHYVGGVVGYNYANGIVTVCYNTGNVIGSGNGIDGGTVGGVVGENGGTVTDCYNTGTVSGNQNVGGVVGCNNGSIVTDCYNTGTVSGGTVGGVVGENYNGTVTDCYNTGTVSGNQNVGGVVGSNDYGTVTDCYYLSGCATDGNGTVQFGIGNEKQGDTTADVSGQTTGLTETQMKQKESFKNWDFETVWDIKADINNGYPILRCFTYETDPKTKGDANTDGKIDAEDLTVLTNALIEGSEYNELLDTNGDGKFDILDFINLKKHLADNTVPLGKQSYPKAELVIIQTVGSLPENKY